MRLLLSLVAFLPLAAGARAVQVGTATFRRPRAVVELLARLPGLLQEIGVDGVRGAVGRM